MKDTEYMKAREAARIQEQVLGMANQIRRLSNDMQYCGSQKTASGFAQHNYVLGL